MSKLTVEQLNVFYGSLHALKNVSFTVEGGIITGVMGPNGSGKSTLLKAILELVPKHSGRVNFDGKKLNQIHTDIAYLPQRQHIDHNFPISVFDTVLLGTYPKLKTFQRPRKTERQLAAESLDELAIGHLANRHIAELSGGQLQRVFLARALAQQADYFFFDEPFTGIDFTSEQLIMQTLKRLKTQGKTIVVVHHDLHTAAQYFDEILLLNKHLIAHGKADQTLTEENLGETFGLKINTSTENNSGNGEKR